MTKCECPEWDQEHNLAPYNDICVACGKPIIQKGGNKMGKEKSAEEKLIRAIFDDDYTENVFCSCGSKEVLCYVGGTPMCKKCLVEMFLKPE